MIPSGAKWIQGWTVASSVIALLAIAACRQSSVDSIIQTPTAAFPHPSSYGIASISGATLNYAVNSWTVDSNGTTSPVDHAIITCIVRDTAALSPSGEYCMAMDLITSRGPKVDTLTGYELKTPDELRLIILDADDRDVDTLSNVELHTPLSSAAHFRSGDTNTVDDVTIDSVSAVVSVPAFLKPAAGAVKTIQRSAFPDDSRPDRNTSVTTTKYFIPGYSSVHTTIVHETTTISTGKKSTRTDQTVLVSASY